MTSTKIVLCLLVTTLIWLRFYFMMMVAFYLLDEMWPWAPGSNWSIESVYPRLAQILGIFVVHTVSNLFSDILWPLRQIPYFYYPKILHKEMEPCRLQLVTEKVLLQKIYVAKKLHASGTVSKQT